MAGGGGPDYIMKVLPRGGSRGVSILVREPGADGDNGTEARGRTCGITV